MVTMRTQLLASLALTAAAVAVVRSQSQPIPVPGGRCSTSEYFSCDFAIDFTSATVPDGFDAGSECLNACENAKPACAAYEYRTSPGVPAFECRLLFKTLEDRDAAYQLPLSFCTKPTTTTTTLQRVSSTTVTTTTKTTTTTFTTGTTTTVTTTTAFSGVCSLVPFSNPVGVCPLLQSNISPVIHNRTAADFFYSCYILTTQSPLDYKDQSGTAEPVVRSGFGNAYGEELAFAYDNGIIGVLTEDASVHKIVVMTWDGNTGTTGSPRELALPANNVFVGFPIVWSLVVQNHGLGQVSAFASDGRVLLFVPHNSAPESSFIGDDTFPIFLFPVSVDYFGYDKWYRPSTSDNDNPTAVVVANPTLYWASMEVICGPKQITCTAAHLAFTKFPHASTPSAVTTPQTAPPTTTGASNNDKQPHVARVRYSPGGEFAAAYSISTATDWSNPTTTDGLGSHIRIFRAPSRQDASIGGMLAATRHYNELDDDVTDIQLYACGAETGDANLHVYAVAVSSKGSTYAWAYTCPTAGDTKKLFIGIRDEGGAGTKHKIGETPNSPPLLYDMQSGRVELYFSDDGIHLTATAFTNTLNNEPGAISHVYRVADLFASTATDALPSFRHSNADPADSPAVIYPLTGMWAMVDVGVEFEYRRYYTSDTPFSDFEDNSLFLRSSIADYVSNGNTKRYADPKDWNVDGIADLSHLLCLKRDTSSAVARCTELLPGAPEFNFDVSGWNVAAATSMDSMFNGATSFDPDLSAWNPAALQTAKYMLNGTAFTGGSKMINGVNIGSLVDASYLFFGASFMDADFDTWATAFSTQFTKTASMFEGALSQSSCLPDFTLNNNLQDASRMFYGATLFDCPLTVKSTADPMTMKSMFEGASSFSQFVNSWSFPASANTQDIFKDTAMTYCMLHGLSRASTWKNNRDFYAQYADRWSGPNPCLAPADPNLRLWQFSFFLVSSVVVGLGTYFVLCGWLCVRKRGTTAKGDVKTSMVI